MRTHRMKIFAGYFLLLSLAGPVCAQWKPASEFQMLPIDNFHALAVVGSTLFAGSGAGVSRSQDGGETWTFNSNGLTSTDVQAFATIGAFVFTATHGGVFRSSDNGDSWIKVNNGLDAAFVQTLVAAGTDLFAGTNGDMYRSRDNGNNWSRIEAGTSPSFSQALVVKGDTLFAGTMNDVFRSSNHGDSWTQAGIVKPGPFAHPVGDIRAFAVTGAYLFAASASQGVFRSADDGDTWTRLDSGLTDIRVSSLASKGGNLFAGTSGGVFRSSDNGLSWLPVSNPESPGTGPMGVVSGLAWRDSSLYAATSGMDGGDVLRSKDNGFTWTSLHDKVKFIGAKDMGPLTGSGSYLFTWTGKGIFRSSDSGSSWESADQGVPGTPILSLAANGSGLLTTTPLGLFQSSNHGAFWSKALASPGITQVNALVASDTLLFAATPTGIFRSLDHGSSWKAAGFADTALGFAAADGAYLLAAGYSASSEVFRSSDQGASWAPIHDGLPDAGIRFLAVHHSVFYIGTETAGVYASKNNGVSWSKVNLGVNANASALVADDSSLFLGTDAGVFQSDNSGETWKPASSGLNPNAVVTDLVLSGTRLVASISGDGLWNRPRSELPAPIVPMQWGRAESGLGRNAGSRLHPGAIVEFTVLRPGYVNLSVYDLKGGKAAALTSGELARGVHHTVFQGAGLAPGLYFLRMVAPGSSETRGFYFER